MKKNYEWTLNVDGVDHIIKFKKKSFKSILTVDGTEKTVNSQSPWMYLLDEAINLGNKTAHLTVLGNSVDLALDDKYLTSGNPYIPFSNIPKWTNTIAIILLGTGWFFGGIMGILFGLTAGIQIIKSVLKGKIQGNSPIVPCAIIIAVCIILQIIWGLIIKALF